MQNINILINYSYYNTSNIKIHTTHSLQLLSSLSSRIKQSHWPYWSCFPKIPWILPINGLATEFLPLNTILYCSELPNSYETSVIIPGSNKGPPTPHFDWMALDSVSRSNCQSSECPSVGPSSVTVYMFGGSSVVWSGYVRGFARGWTKTMLRKGIS